ncbi:hypothetical protein SAMN04487785_11510 [Dyella jiangningensis]|uniref:hypothetical protein n=1 Tax=Dyella sp. AtDHG13 TaxID=1938897 RepID=UPI000886A4B4|nr:hypothetical protein [Dyella sp. AtDHG13]PXV58628.1 hypothetical protein BDW41_105137 [Dyella sp. AtDHG13]SDL12635.1 hypothetical protein SAMN04487785_11510 [Dyella jiangningensis]
MKIVRTTVFVAASLLAATAWAQNSEQPLNLKLPANLPASSASAATANTAAPTDASKAVSGRASTTAQASAPATQANAQTGAYAKDPPGTYYGDTSGALGDTQAAASAQPAATCDDATYNQPQVHGAVTTGVVAGNHFSGSYGGAGVTLSQAFGSCEHPTGGMSISVSGSQGHFGR